MMSEIPVLKDVEHQASIPTLWRPVIIDIVGAFVEKDFVLQRGLTGVEAVSAERASTIAANIDKYGCSLMKLPEAAWQTSVCQWMEGYWDVLIDLYTVEEGESDLALVMRVYEKNESYNFVVQSVHVP